MTTSHQMKRLNPPTNRFHVRATYLWNPYLDVEKGGNMGGGRRRFYPPKGMKYSMHTTCSAAL